MKKAAALIVAAAVLVSTESVTGVWTPGVIAAEAATVKKKSYDMAIAETLKLDSKISGKSKSATYTYKSSKTSIASVSKKGVVTAKKAGKTQITVTEVKGGKKKTVGTVKVTVHKLEHNGYDWFFSAAEGRYEKYPYQLKVKDFFNYVNPKATYTWSCKKPEVITITKKGKITHMDASALSKKEGYSFRWDWIDLVIKETYKGKTSKFTYTIRVAEPGFEDKESGSTIELKKGEIFDVTSYVAMGTGADYGVMISDEYKTEQELWAIINDAGDDNDSDDASDDIYEKIFDKDGYWTCEIKAKETGKLYVYYFAYNYTKGEFDRYIGYYVINITE